MCDKIFNLLQRLIQLFIILPFTVIIFPPLLVGVLLVEVLTANSSAELKEGTMDFVTLYGDLTKDLLLGRAL